MGFVHAKELDFKNVNRKHSLQKIEGDYQNVNCTVGIFL